MELTTRRPMRHLGSPTVRSPAAAYSQYSARTSAQPKARHCRFHFRLRWVVFRSRSPGGHGHAVLSDLRFLRAGERRDAFHRDGGPRDLAPGVQFRQKQRDHHSGRELVAWVICDIECRVRPRRSAKLPQRQQPAVQFYGPARRAGQAITIWATGLGPVTFPDNVAPTPGNVATPVTVTVGGQPASVSYSGARPVAREWIKSWRRSPPTRRSAAGYR